MLPLLGTFFFLPNGYLSLDEFKTQFPDVDANLLLYEGVIRAIKRFNRNLVWKVKKNLSLTIHVFGNACQRVVFSVFTLAFFRIMRLQSHRKLSQTLNMYTVHCKRIFTKIKKTTNAFRWLHYKILYILLPTGRCLYLRRMVDSALCAFCHNAEETLTHMFWNCPKVQTVLD